MTEDDKRPGSAGDANLHQESDEKAPVKGADPQGESAPDGGTKAEQQTGSAPEVSSSATEADQSVADDQASDVAVPERRAEVLEVRKGMFGIRGTGDTSGYGGLTRVIEFPPPTEPPFGGWWDQVYERVGALMPNYFDVITKVVIHRGEITFHVAAPHIAELV